MKATARGARARTRPRKSRSKAEWPVTRRRAPSGGDALPGSAARDRAARSLLAGCGVWTTSRAMWRPIVCVERVLDGRRARRGGHGRQHLVLVQRDRRVQVDEALDAADVGAAPRASGSGRTARRSAAARERRPRAPVEDDDDARRLLPRELAAQEILAPPRLGARRAACRRRSRPGGCGRTGRPSRRSRAVTGTSTCQGWAMTTVVMRTQTPRPPAARCPRGHGSRQGVHPRPEHRQERGQERQARRARRTPTTMVPQSPMDPRLPRPQRVEAQQPHGDREAGEEDGLVPPWPWCGRAPRPAGRSTDLLAVAAHDEQRVVDGDGEADHGDHVGRVDGHRRDAREQQRARHPAGHGQQPDAERARPPPPRSRRPGAAEPGPPAGSRARPAPHRVG